MSFTSLLVLLGLVLVSLGCAIYSLIGSTRRRSFYIIWTVCAAILVYVVMCAAVLAYWRKKTREKSLAATRREALDRSDDIFRIHAQRRDSHHERTPYLSATNSSTTLKSPGKDNQKSTHPGPLSSNPPYGPPSNVFYIPALPPNLSDLALSMPAFHTASSVTVTPIKSRAIQIPARTRAATDAGHTTTTAAASRTRANSLLQIREATARRMTAAMPPTTPPPSSTRETFDFDS